MRSVRYSHTFYEELACLLEQGLDRFGASVVAQKRDLVLQTITSFLVSHPVRPVDADLGICAYPVSGAPFVIVYDYDEAELRIHLIIHARADRTAVDLSTVVW